MSAARGCLYDLATADEAGAIAIVHLTGDVAPVLAELTGVATWGEGERRLASLAGIDDGVVVRVRGDVAQLMPHGGRRVVRHLLTWLEARGVTRAPEPDSPDALQTRWPEAADVVEALLLDALSRAVSPLAIGRLLLEPDRWRRTGQPLTEEDHARARRLNRMIVPPRVVLVGPPNVGKSTLGNRLAGRSLSIAADEPGTTRDYVTATLDLEGLVVRWHDTPGVRRSDDRVEREARQIAESVRRTADLVIAVHDNGTPPSSDPDVGLLVQNKIDLDGCPPSGGVIGVSARTGEGIETLVSAIREMLVPHADLEHPGRWLFDVRLESWV